MNNTITSDSESNTFDYVPLMPNTSDVNIATDVNNDFCCCCRSDRVNEFCLTPTQQFSAISWQQHVNFQLEYGEVRFVLDQHA